MCSDIPFWLSLVFMAGGLAALAWSSDLFVDGAATVAKALGISPFIIGMVIIGFGTSAPELCVSTMSGISGHANLSLGNAYGSCIFNIAIILGVATLIFPLVVKPSVTFIAGPGLTLISLFSLIMLKDGSCSRVEAIILLAAFLVILPLYCWYDQKTKDQPEEEVKAEAKVEQKNILVPIVKLVVGLGVLIGSSHFLVWGAVDFAKFCGVSDLVIGLTIVASGVGERGCVRTARRARVRSREHCRIQPLQHACGRGSGDVHFAPCSGTQRRTGVFALRPHARSAAHDGAVAFHHVLRHQLEASEVAWRDSAQGGDGLGPRFCRVYTFDVLSGNSLKTRGEGER